MEVFKEPDIKDDSFTIVSHGLTCLMLETEGYACVQGMQRLGKCVSPYNLDTHAGSQYINNNKMS